MDDDILDTSAFHFDGNFDDQVQSILQRVRLTRAEVQDLRLLMNDLEESLQQLGTGCKVTPFGSIVTGLGIRTSDVDCYVCLPPGILPTKHCVMTAKKILQQNRALYTNLFAITAAKVPIVKFLHIPTGFHCDVSFKSPSGVRNSELIAFLLQMDSRALPLAILIKYWSKVYKFTGTNLMPNYALSLLVIFYLQIRNILPSVNVLQKKVEPVMIDNWNTSFNNRIYYSSESQESLYELMGGFFKYYSSFDWEHNVVAPFLGRVVSKKALIENVPKELDLYAHNVSRKVCKEMRVDTLMCVQDPFDHSRNCTVAIFPRLMEKVMGHFRFAAIQYDQVNSDNFLRAVFTEDPTPELDSSNNSLFRPPQVNQHDQRKPNLVRGIAKRKPRQRTYNFKHNVQNNVRNMYIGIRKR